MIKFITIIVGFGVLAIMMLLSNPDAGDVVPIIGSHASIDGWRTVGAAEAEDNTVFGLILLAVGALWAYFSK